MMGVIGKNSSNTLTNLGKLIQKRQTHSNFGSNITEQKEYHLICKLINMTNKMMYNLITSVTCYN